MTTEEGELFAVKLELTAKRLGKWAYKTLRDPTLAEDLVRDTVCKSWIKRDSYREIPGKRLEDWMANMMKNIYYDQYEKKKSTRGIYFVTLKEKNELTDFNSYEKTIESDYQEFMIEKLPVHLQDTIRLYKKGYGYPEIAAIQDISYGTVKQRKMIAVAKLKKMIKLEL